MSALGVGGIVGFTRLSSTHPAMWFDWCMLEAADRLGPAMTGPSEYRLKRANVRNQSISITVSDL